MFSALSVWMAPAPVYAKGVVDAAYVPTPQVQSIVAIVGRAIGAPVAKEAPTHNHASDANDASPSLAALNTWAQHHLKRPAHIERTEPKAIAHYAALYDALDDTQRAKVRALFAEMGDVGFQAPPHSAYDYLLIHGTTVQGMRARVMALSDAVQRHELALLPTTKIIFLDGERPLFASETQSVLRDPAPYPMAPEWIAPAMWPKDERSAAELVWSQLHLSKSMRRVAPVFVHAPKQKTARRAETEDTVALWAKQDTHIRGRALMVSENPFIEYQRLITQTLLYHYGIKALALDAMGPDIRLANASDVVRLGVLLDNLAGCLFWAQRMQNKQVPVY